MPWTDPHCGYNPSNCPYGDACADCAPSKERMRVYLAGPMSGIPEHNFPAFRAATDALREQGYTVMSPVEMDEAEGFDAATAPNIGAGSPEWSDFLARDVGIVAKAETEGVVVLPGWESSRGAALEVHVARELGKPIFRYPSLERIPERHPSSARFHAILHELGALHDRKQADYGRGNDPFANVRGSSAWGIPEWVGAMIRAADKVRRLETFARRGSLANESAVDSFADLAVYAVIALVLYEEASAGAPAATDSPAAQP